MNAHQQALHNSNHSIPSHRIHLIVCNLNTIAPYSLIPGPDFHFRMASTIFVYNSSLNYDNKTIYYMIVNLLGSRCW